MGFFIIPSRQFIKHVPFFLAFLCKEVERSRSTTEQRAGAGTDLLKDHFIREDCRQDMSLNLDLFQLAWWTHTHKHLQLFFTDVFLGKVDAEITFKPHCAKIYADELCLVLLAGWSNPSIQFKRNHYLTDRDHRLLSGMTETAVVLVVKTVQTSAGSKHAHIHSLWGSSRPFLWFWHVLLWCVTGCQLAGWEDRDYPWLTLCFRQVVLR